MDFYLPGGVLRFTLAALFCLNIAAAARAAQAPPDDEYRISLMTLGPGDAVYERFGHNTLAVQVLKSGKSYSFNYGVFDFFEDNFIARFLQGRMDYKVKAIDFEWERDYYIKNHRSILLQELNLKPDRKRALVNFLINNAQPENCTYRYNYYTANCSTKVRDALDFAFEGELSRQLKTLPTTDTWRERTRSISQYNFFIYTGLNFALGPPTDRPLSAWEADFLPQRLSEDIARMKFPDGRPLVLSSKYLSDVRPTAFTSPANWVWLYLLLAAAWSGLIVYCTTLLPKGKRWPAVIATQSWLLLCALGGVFITWIYTTSHWAVSGNQNVLLLPPTALLLSPMLIRAHFGWRWIGWPTIPLLLGAAGVTFIGLFIPFGLSLLAVVAVLAIPRNLAHRLVLPLALVPVATCLLALVAKALPWPQQNGEIIALAIPMNLACAWACWKLRERHETIRQPG